MNSNYKYVYIFILFVLIYLFLVFQTGIQLSKPLVIIIIFLTLVVFGFNMYSAKDDLQDMEEERKKLDVIEKVASIICISSLAMSIFLKKYFKGTEEQKEKIIQYIIIAFSSSILTLILWWTPVDNSSFYRILGIVKVSFLTISISFLLFTIYYYMPNFNTKYII